MFTCNHQHTIYILNLVPQITLHKLDAPYTFSTLPCHQSGVHGAHATHLALTTGGTY